MDVKRALTTPMISLNKKGYNEVAYVRRGKDYEDFLGSNGGAGFRKIDTVWVTTKTGEKYEIPIDKKTGKVPNEYLYARFLNEGVGGKKGQRNVVIDISKDAETIHVIPSGGFTPQQLIETGWWQHPNESDVADIDDTGSISFAREIEEATKSARKSGMKMVFLMPPESAERAREIIARDFNASEIKKAVKNGGIIIKEGNPGRGASGCYVGRQEAMSMKTPVIVLRPGWDEETLVHEMTHHLRQEDVTRGGIARTPMKLNAMGEKISSKRQDRSEYNSSLNLEEAATVAESLIRVGEIEYPNGYFNSTKAYGNTPMERMNHDRALLAGSGTKKGRKAEKELESKFTDTSISHLGHYRPGSNAVGYLNERKKAGTLPKAEKLLKKTKAKTVTAGYTGPVAATASRNRMPYRKK